MDLTNFPETVVDFEQRFPNETACWEFLWQAKWPNGFVCTRCQGSKAYFVIERRLEECAGCGHQASVTSGTAFHQTHSELRRWFRAILEFVSRKHGCNAKDIERLIGVSYPTAWRWLHKIREAFGRRERRPLSGTVEVDESYVGGPEEGVHGRDLGEKKILIAAAVEVDGERCGRVRLEPIASAKTESVQVFVAETVAVNSTVRTDGLKSYAGLEHEYRHKVTVIGDAKTASVKFPRVHRVFSLFKRLLLGTYHGSWSSKYAPAYCEEYEFRFNRRTSANRVRLFQRVVEAAQHGAPSIFRPSRAKALNSATS